MFLKIQKRRIRLDQIESFTLHPTSGQLEFKMISGTTYYSNSSYNIKNGKQKLLDIADAIANSYNIEL